MFIKYGKLCIYTYGTMGYDEQKYTQKQEVKYGNH